MIRRIVDGGHELASHGYEHCRATEQGYGQFLADIRLAKAVLEDTSGGQVKGYRAPSFSVGPRNHWAFECIAEAGYRYSSSVYPIRHDHYGTPDAPRFAHEVFKGLLELPITTVRMLHSNWPAGGGGYFRLLPYRRVAVVDPARQCDRSAACAVLFPPVGARSRTSRASRVRERKPDSGITSTSSACSRECAAC